MLRRLLGVCLFVTTIATVVAAPTSAATVIQVAGTQTIVDESAGAYEMHGSLVGKWNITAFVPRYESPSQLVATGKEKFVGCIDTSKNGACEPVEPAGTMSFTFVYWATFDPATKALVRGACVHPILSGTGSFAGAKGVIHMKDTPVGDAVRTTYKGTIAYQSAGTSGRALAARANQGGARGCGS